MEKMSLYKFTHMPLLKNDGQLIQKSDKQPQKKKKKQSPNLLKNKMRKCIFSPYILSQFPFWLQN